MSNKTAKKRGREFVWDGRGEHGEDMRYSIIPGRAADDVRLTGLHFRILAHLGRFNHKRGWCRMSQTDLAAKFQVRRPSLSTAINQLVEWKYIEKRDQRQSGESFCLYRAMIDALDGDCETKGGVSGKSDTPHGEGVSGKSDTSVSHSEHPCQAGANTPPSGSITTRARIDRIDRIERGGTLREFSAANDDGKTCLSDDWRLPADWRQWTENNFFATEADIQKSADVFHLHHRQSATALTPKGWALEWKKWCKRERLFPARVQIDATVRAPVRINPDIQLTALQHWCKGIGGWDVKIGPEPKSEAEALARIAALGARSPATLSLTANEQGTRHEQS
jgi:hypothetical protein